MTCETPLIRCTWPGSDPLYCAYHDQEWGVPEYDSRALWEKLVLDGFQAGLSWITILRKRDAFRAAFAGFDPEVVARFGEADVARLLGDAGIIRSRSKIEAGIDFSQFVWDFVDGRPIVNAWRTTAEVATETPLSHAVSKALKARGFKFVGPVIVHAWMEATGVVNDHLATCFRHGEVQALARRS